MSKNLHFLVVFILILATYTYGQTYVDPGEGTLSTAIANASDGDVLLLIGGEEYTEATDKFGSIDKAITIMVEDTGEDDYIKPKLYFTVNDGTGKNFFELLNGASITLKGLELDGRVGEEIVADHGIQADITDALVDTWINKIVIDDCYIHDLNGHGLDAGNSDMKEKVVYDSTWIHNSVFYNMQSSIYYKYSGANYIEITNSTFHLMTSYGIRVAGPGESGDFENTAGALIDHTTWYDMGSQDGRETILLEKGPNLRPWIVRNSIIQKQANLSKTVVNLKDNQGVQSEAYNLCWWDVGPRKFENNSNIVHDTLLADPQFLDPENGDFTLPEGSPLLTFGSEGGPIGDPRWAVNAPTAVDDAEELPTELSLSQNYPNPFNPTTNISFSIPESGLTKLVVYDLLGREAAVLINANISAGQHSVEFNAENLTSGIYLYRLISNNVSVSKKMLLLK